MKTALRLSRLAAFRLVVVVLAACAVAACAKTDPRLDLKDPLKKAFNAEILKKAPNADELAKIVATGMDADRAAWETYPAYALIAADKLDTLEALSKKLDLGSTDSAGEDALFFAMRLRRPAIARWLLENGADAERSNAAGKTAFEILPAKPDKKMAAVAEWYKAKIAAEDAKAVGIEASIVQALDDKDPESIEKALEDSAAVSTRVHRRISGKAIEAFIEADDARSLEAFGKRLDFAPAAADQHGWLLRAVELEKLRAIDWLGGYLFYRQHDLYAADYGAALARLAADRDPDGFPAVSRCVLAARCSFRTEGGETAGDLDAEASRQYGFMLLAEDGASASRRRAVELVKEFLENGERFDPAILRPAKPYGSESYGDFPESSFMLACVNATIDDPEGAVVEFLVDCGLPESLESSMLEGGYRKTELITLYIDAGNISMAENLAKNGHIRDYGAAYDCLLGKPEGDDAWGDLYYALFEGGADPNYARDTYLGDEEGRLEPNVRFYGDGPNSEANFDYPKVEYKGDTVLYRAIQAGMQNFAKALLAQEADPRVQRREYAVEIRFESVEEGPMIAYRKPGKPEISTALELAREKGYGDLVALMK
jgi:hypothetical protein